MTSIQPFRYSAALTVLRSATQTPTPEAPQSAASQILASMTGRIIDPLRMAEGAISRIVFGSGQAIVGGAFSTIKGTDENDVIDAGPGSSVSGGAGDDTIVAGPSSTVHGGSGDDTIRGVLADSQIEGGSGNDMISASSNSSVDGGEGDDSIRIMGGGSRIDGGEGHDAISVIGRGNRIDGAGGEDLVSVTAGNEIAGGAGADTITALGGGSEIDGGSGDDAIHLIGWPTRGRSADFSSTVKFSAGDGKDTISVADTAAVLELGEGLSADDTRITVSGNEAVTPSTATTPTRSP